MTVGRILAGLAATAMLAASPAGAHGYHDWKPADTQNTLVIDTTKGRVFIELHPEMAPKAVERIKLLARRGTYDGLLFHRVITGFVAQTGDPGNHDGGKTELPNLPPEFTFRLPAAVARTVAARPAGLSEGFIGAMPYVSVSETAVPKHDDGSLYAWGTQCAGVFAMGRDEAPDSANSELYVMLASWPGLDHNYTPAGRIISGLAVVHSLAVGEPPDHPDAMVKVQMLADMKDAPQIDILNTQGAEFAHLVKQARARSGADFSVCDVDVPFRIRP